MVRPVLIQLSPSTPIRLTYPYRLPSGDTKAGRLVGTDRAGNKYFENNEELPLRTRWVSYAKHDFDASHIEPGWHAWMSYMTETTPGAADVAAAAGSAKTLPAKPRPNLTMSRGAFKTYST